MSEQPTTIATISTGILQDILHNIIQEVSANAILHEQHIRKRHEKMIPVQLGGMSTDSRASSVSLEKLNGNGNANGYNSHTASPYTGSPFKEEPEATSVNTRIEFSRTRGKDIYGYEKPNDSSRYFTCGNCSRKIAGGRFAAHIDRCLGGRSRK